jgi:hypothetical protein
VDVRIKSAHDENSGSQCIEFVEHSGSGSKTVQTDDGKLLVERYNRLPLPRLSPGGEGETRASGRVRAV